MIDRTRYYNRMENSTSTALTLDARDGQPINVQIWAPKVSSASQAKGVVQIAHGMGEHIARYAEVASSLNDAGYWVYGNNHRGHGPNSIPASIPGAMGPDGWNQTLADMHSINRHIQQEHPELPNVLLGHSMGSMLTCQYLYRWGHDLDGVVLCGAPGFAHPMQTLMLSAIATFERWRHGQNGASELLQKMLFADANTAYDGPGASGYEWLSRDAEQVERYVQDPLCGFVLSAGSLVDLARGRREAAQLNNLRSIPKQLPLYVISGTKDAVHNDQKNLDRMFNAFRSVGVNPDIVLYPEARHELFNETNREQVLSELVAWLDRKAKAN